MAIQPDHLHLFVRVTPSTSAADVVNASRVSRLSRCDASSRQCSVCRPCGRAPISLAIATGWRVSGLEEQLSTRRVIEWAAGILMERYGHPAPEAFRRMGKLAMNNHMSMRKVAEAILLIEDLSESALR